MAQVLPHNFADLTLIRLSPPASTPTPPEVSLRHVVAQAAALKSYRAHDAPDGGHSLPEAAEAKKDKALTKAMASVSVGKSSTPEYGTKEYAEWYYAWQRYYASQGNEKAMAHVVAPKEKQDLMSRKAHAKIEKEMAATVAAERAKQGAPRPAAEEEEEEEDDGGLESCKVGRGAPGPAMGAWSTVAVRRVEPAGSPLEEEAEESDDDENADSNFRSLSFNFSKKPPLDGRSGGTGFRVRTWSSVKLEAACRPSQVKVELGAQGLAVSGGSAATALMQIKQEFDEERASAGGGGAAPQGSASSGAGFKRKADFGGSQSKGKRQFRRKTDDDDG